MQSTLIVKATKFITVFVLNIFSLPIALAHDFSITETTIFLDSSNTYKIDMLVDVDALALGVSPTSDSEQVVSILTALSLQDLEQAKQKARQTIQRRIRLRFDGTKHVPTITFPDHGTKFSVESELPTFLGLTARLSGEIPQFSKELTFGASRAFKVVNLTIVDKRVGRTVQQLLGVGEDSPPYDLQSRSMFGGEETVILRYILVGFEHIFPKGLDHILFVLGLFLFSCRLRPLLWQITAFTLAHSITLALSIFGLFTLPSRPVEALIALSIVYVGIENMVTTELKPWRPMGVFVFGLLHGLGFAQVLRQVSMPKEHFLTALLTFNLGVEFGQITVLALAFLLFGWFIEKPWYRQRVVLPGSVLICLIATYWCIERTFL